MAQKTKIESIYILLLIKRLLACRCLYGRTRFISGGQACLLHHFERWRKGGRRGTMAARFRFPSPSCSCSVTKEELWEQQRFLLNWETCFPFCFHTFFFNVLKLLHAHLISGFRLNLQGNQFELWQRKDHSLLLTPLS